MSDTCECGDLIAEHIGGKPCTTSEPPRPRGLYDLPIFGWAWSEPAAERQG